MIREGRKEQPGEKKKRWRSPPSLSLRRRRLLVPSPDPYQPSSVGQRSLTLLRPSIFLYIIATGRGPAGRGPGRGEEKIRPSYVADQSGALPPAGLPHVLVRENILVSFFTV
jgi:hypothetical protein